MPFITGAFAAIAAGTATVATMATVASTVGIGLSVVGAITKNEDLMKIGKVLSIGGAVVGMGAGIASAFGAAGEAAASTAVDMAIDPFAAGAPEVAASGASALEGATTSAVNDASAGLTSGLPSAGEMAGKASGLLNAPPASQPPIKYGEVNLGNFGQPMADQAFNAVSLRPPPATNPGAIKSWWGGLDENMKNRIVQGGTQAVRGLFDGWTQEQKLALERERMNLDKDRYATSVANANAQPSIAFKPVGLLNAPRGA